MLFSMNAEPQRLLNFRASQKNMITGIHSQGSDIDESKTKAIDASQPKLSDERDKCNDKRLMLIFLKETQFQTEEMQAEFKISGPVEFVAQQPAQITRRSQRLTNKILEECYNEEFSPFFVPTSIEQARNIPEAKLWEDAIQTEIDSVYLNNTFSEPMILPKGKKAMKLKNFLFAFKFNDKGKIDRYKARLVFQHVKRISTVDW